MASIVARLCLVVTFCGLFFAVTGANGVRAQGEAALTIRPTEGTNNYFSLELHPGERRTIEVELGNGGEDSVAAWTYAANVYTLINGGFGVALADQEPIGTTEWLDYESGVFDLPGGETVRRTATIAVPDDVEPGEYITSLVIQNAEPIEGSGGVALNQVFRQAIAVAIDIPGPRTAGLAIGDATYQSDGTSASLMVGVENTGNVRIRPVGELVVRDTAGETVIETEVEMLTVYAKTVTAIELGLSDLLPAGQYTVALSLKDKGTRVTAKADPLPLTVSYADTAMASPEPAASIALSSVSVNELRDPASDALQGVELVVAIDHNGEPIENARLTLHVIRDGEKVEDFVLGSSLSFPGGQAEFRQRYLPMTGWTTGTWHFSVTLDVVDPNTGTVTELATVDVANEVVVS